MWANINYLGYAWSLEKIILKIGMRILDKSYFLRK